MTAPSVFGAIKAIIAGDFLFSLFERRAPRGYPFAELLVLCVTFVALTPLFFVDVAGNGIVLGALTTFIAFWGAVLMSVLIVLMFGLSAPPLYVQKATFVALATFAVAVLLFDFNLLFGLDRIEYVGDDWDPKWMVPLAYTLPYPVFCLVRSEWRLRRRFAIALERHGKTREPKERHIRLRALRASLRLKAYISATLIVAFSAVMMDAGVLSESPGSFRAAVEAVTAALQFKPS